MSAEPSPKANGQSAAAPSPFPPIADYAFLSNCHTGALVAPDGAVDWLCIPSFDSPSVFGSLLDRGAGAFRLGPFGINHPTRRSTSPARTSSSPRGRRRPAGSSSATLSPSGPGAARTRSRRTRALLPTTTPTTCWSGRSSASTGPSRSSSCASRCSTTHACRPSGRSSTTAGTPPTRAGAASPSGCRPTWRSGSRATASGHGMRSTGASGSSASLSWGEDLVSPVDVDEAVQRLDATVQFWRRWLGRARLPDHRWRDPIQRSALAIKGLTYMPTGSTVAALTTSLPETPGGERNWDYRFTWMRDSTFTLRALHFLNLDWEADEFIQFVADLESERRRRAADHVRDRRPAGPDGVDPGRALRLRGRPAGARRQRRVRPASERRLRRRPRLFPAPHSQEPAPAAAPVADHPGPGRVRHAGLARTPTRASGRRAARRSTTSRRSSCAGSRWTARPNLAGIRGEPESRGHVAAAPLTRSRRTFWSTA